MKKLLMICGVLAILTACKDDTKELLKAVDGNWMVNTITYIRQSGTDSIITPPSLYLNFESCTKSGNNSSPGNCGVYYVADNKEFPFAYQATDGNQSISITADRAPNDQAYKAIYDQLVGSYEVATLNNTQLVIRRELQLMPGFKSIQYSATK